MQNLLSILTTRVDHSNNYYSPKSPEGIFACMQNLPSILTIRVDHSTVQLLLISESSSIKPVADTFLCRMCPAPL